MTCTCPLQPERRKRAFGGTWRERSSALPSLPASNPGPASSGRQQTSTDCGLRSPTWAQRARSCRRFPLSARPGLYPPRLRGGRRLAHEGRQAIPCPPSCQRTDHRRGPVLRAHHVGAERRQGLRGRTTEGFRAHQEKSRCGLATPGGGTGNARPAFMETAQVPLPDRLFPTSRCCGCGGCAAHTHRRCRGPV